MGEIRKKDQSQLSQAHKTLEQLYLQLPFLMNLEKITRHYKDVSDTDPNYLVTISISLGII